MPEIVPDELAEPLIYMKDETILLLISRFVLVRQAIMCTLEGATAAALTTNAEGCTAKPDTAAAMASTSARMSFILTPR
jgi:hypothetical protein